MNTTGDSLDRVLAALPLRYAGPGGAVAVLREGKVLARHAWGWADIERRIPFTPQTMALVCSITKQFTCSLLLDLFSDPDVLDEDVRRRLPGLGMQAPRTRDLCHNQSGLRDYWATAMLSGAAVEGVFGQQDADRLIGRTRSLHFAPGTRYSYCNQNFRLLSEMIEQRTGQPYAELLRKRIFDRAGMPRAMLNPDTSAVAGGTIGYEGTLDTGFRAAVNHIYWTGDAGLAACLDDFIAWESFIDATRDDADGLYNRLSAPQTFKDGAPAHYGFGLGQGSLLGRRITSHGGGLRGWRSFRFHAPAERVSVVVLFNHMADPRAAAVDLFGALFDQPVPESVQGQAGDWAGRYMEPETGLAVRLEATHDQRLRLHYAPSPELLGAAADGDFVGSVTRLHREGDSIVMSRPTDNLTTRLTPCAGEPTPDIEGVFHTTGIEGVFHTTELDADLVCVSAGGALYGAFSGELGSGAMQSLLPFAPDVWLLPCPRALDHQAPGDWTLAFTRDGSGQVNGVRVGCWLARAVEYTRS